jgi:hypothetical protein
MKLYLILLIFNIIAMGKKNRNRNKSKRRPVSLSLSEYSEKYGIELFKQEDNLLPTAPSNITAPRKDEEYLNKNNWRGSNVQSAGDVMVESKADTEINWRGSNIKSESDVIVENKADTEINWRSRSSTENNNSYVLPNVSNFSIRNKETTNSFVPRVSKFTTNSNNNNSYVSSNKPKFSLKRNEDSTSKFTFRNKESEHVFVPSNRFNFKNVSNENLIKPDEKNTSRFKQFNKWQEDLSKKQELLVEKSIKRKEIEEKFSFKKKPEPKGIPNVPDDNNVKVMKKKKKKKKKKNEGGFFLMELTQKDKDMIKASVRMYEDEESEEEVEVEEEDGGDGDFGDDKTFYSAYNKVCFEPKYI